MQETCEKSITSNNCEKVKGVDTCFCGMGKGCEEYGSRPKCVNSYGISRPKDLSLTCKAGKPKMLSMKNLNTIA